MLVAVAVVCSTIAVAPERSGVGALLLLAGIPIYYIFKWFTGRRATYAPPPGPPTP